MYVTVRAPESDDQIVLHSSSYLTKITAFTKPPVALIDLSAWIVDERLNAS